jgi:hypothetical protein
MKQNNAENEKIEMIITSITIRRYKSFNLKINYIISVLIIL